MKKIFSSIIVILLLIFGYFYKDELGTDQKTGTIDRDDVVVIYFPSDKYPETARHIKNAIKAGESKYCTIDRKHADENREKSLKNVPTKKGYDRDEYPMAMCEEGGSGADIEYISPSDNRGAGSWVSHQLSNYPDGTVVLFEVN
ncbi:NucA/NucB deoxyribonuclease domain-containing protein [Heyndrickxia sp. NPDC080065]|uniref:NucA/NucB deoxyribonuclease domain-containing protein n=1 Tax=Heyndrickxia sp. NPDC080065 TaxID=3390568 RepID=UPI003CFD931D